MIDNYRPVLKNHNFLYLWSSQLLSQLTINIMNFVLLIKLFEKTNSTIATSFLWIAYALPAIFFGPIASAVVDIIDRRKMLIITNLLQALTIFLYALVHKFSPFLVYGVVVAYSFLNQFYMPAEAAALPSVLNKKDLPEGNSLFFITMQGALIVGFGLAGIILNLFGFEKTLFLSAFFVFLAFISTVFLPDMKVEVKIKKDIETVVDDFIHKIFEGYNFIKSNKSILASFVLLLGVQVFLSIIIVSVPLIAKDIFSVSINMASIYIIVPAGIGATIGAFLIPRLVSSGWRKKIIISRSLLLTSLLFYTFTILIPAIPLYFKQISGVVLTILLGISFIGIMIPSQTYIQE